MDTKHCSGCKQILLISLFSKDKYQKSGYRCKCKVCSAKEFNAFKNSSGYEKRKIKTKQKTDELKQTNPIKRWAHVAFHNAKKRAKASNLEFSITKDWLENNAPKICPLLNVELNYGASKATENTASVDRINSTQGYTTGNCKIISFKANRIKNNASLKELQLLTQNMAVY